jgi:hypothetical protein
MILLLRFHLYRLQNRSEMKNQSLFLALTYCIFAASLSAQTYNTAIGIRFDDGMNLTAKQSIGPKTMLELMLHTPILSSDVGATLLFEKHRKILTRNMSFYYGAGPHLYMRSAGRQSDFGYDTNVYGLSGIGGLDLCVGRLNFSVDILPELHLIGDALRTLDWNGLSVSGRYIFDKKERKKLRDRVNLPDWKGKDKKKGQKRSSGRTRRS